MAVHDKHHHHLILFRNVHHMDAVSAPVGRMIPPQENAMALPAPSVPPPSVAIVWFRRDLRVEDNAALVAALHAAHLVVSGNACCKACVEGKQLSAMAVAWVLLVLPIR